MASDELFCAASKINKGYYSKIRKIVQIKKEGASGKKFSSRNNVGVVYCS